MDVVVYPGPQQSAVAALQAHLASRNGMRVASQSWAGDNLMVVYEFDDPRSTFVKSTFAIVAALALGFAGLQMISLHSIGGNTVAELFDNAVGIMSIGLALFAVAYAAG